MVFVIPKPKTYEGSNFHEDWPYRTQVVTISLDTEDSKWWISGKKGPNITQISKANVSETV